MFDRMKKYPARTQAAVVAVVSTVTAFGVNWSADQVGAVTTLSAALIALFLERPGGDAAGREI